MTTSKTCPPAILIICGISGDLARRKVLPAIYQLLRSGQLDGHTYFVGTSRRHIATEDIISQLRDTLVSNNAAIDETSLTLLADHLSMAVLDPEQADDYTALRTHLNDLEAQAGTCLQRYFYLSIPPQAYTTVISQLGEHGLNSGCQHNTTSSHLLVEKPFGYDYDSAVELISDTAKYFTEDQLFRIDHYLAKETAQNILQFRQHNPLFDTVWNGRSIRRIAITASEAIGIEGRANFYDQIGALRDLIQSHLLQLLAVTMMDVPSSFDAATIHQNKQAMLEALIPPSVAEIPTRTVRGQYASYRQDTDKPDSNTETFASVILYSQHPNWQNVPLQLTTGKALDKRYTAVSIDFADDDTNRLEFRIQPNEGISLELQVKSPGLSDKIAKTALEFDYQEAFQLDTPIDAYERVLVAALQADQTMFASSDEVLAAWRVVEPIIQAWQTSSDSLQPYADGSSGPDISQLSI